MNSFGKIFRVSVFGESHGPETGVVLDGVIPGISLSEEDFAGDIARRKSGAKGTTPRIENDTPRIVSGVFDGRTTGAPLAILFANGNTRSSDYSRFAEVPRPGHADYTASVKWGGFNDLRGGGHFSGRLTLPVVAAGVVAKKIAAELSGRCGGQFSVNARLVEIGGVPLSEAEKRTPGASDPAMLWAAELDAAIKDGDSLGGVAECVVGGIPAGLGEPFFDSVESLISHAVFSIPGVRGIEFGDGFAASRMRGSEHNDPFVSDGMSVKPAKNGAGGINGGLTNGGPIMFRVAFKPTSSIRKVQSTLDLSSGAMTELEIPGRHDACFALRAPVVVEAMTAAVLADLMEIALF